MLQILPKLPPKVSSFCAIVCIPYTKTYTTTYTITYTTTYTIRTFTTNVIQLSCTITSTSSFGTKFCTVHSVIWCLVHSAICCTVPSAINVARPKTVETRAAVIDRVSCPCIPGTDAGASYPPILPMCVRPKQLCLSTVQSEKVVSGIPAC